MKNKFLITSFIALWFHCTSFAQLISYDYYKKVSMEDFASTMRKNRVPQSFVKSNYDVDVYDILYWTKWHDGSKIKASGLYFVPAGLKDALPLIVNHHGTRVISGRAKDLAGEEYMSVAMATDGYLVAMPDYIGLGRGEKFHLYQHAESIGQSTIDIIIACRELDEKLGIKRNGQLFLTGYSEGGYATLAAQKLIQEKYSDQIKVTAASAMSGAYDMAGIQSGVMFRKYSQPHYLPYLLNSYNEVYNIAGDDISVIYNPPYDSIVPMLFDGKHNIRSINNALPDVPGNMIRDSFLALFRNDTNFAFTKALKMNQLYDWKPEQPLQLCYCNSDEQVMYQNSIKAFRTMKKNGAKHIMLRNGGRKYNHYKCAIFSGLYTKMYFDSFRKGSKYGRKGPVLKRIELGIAKLFIKK